MIEIGGSDSTSVNTEPPAVSLSVFLSQIVILIFASLETDPRVACSSTSGGTLAYPDSRFEVLNDHESSEGQLKWRIECRDCPDEVYVFRSEQFMQDFADFCVRHIQLYYSGPYVTLINFELHLQSHRDCAKEVLGTPDGFVGGRRRAGQGNYMT